MQLKNFASWSLRLVALVCLACAMAIPFTGARPAGSENLGDGTAANTAGAEKSADSAATNAASDDGGCFRAAVGSEVPEPEDLRSVDGLLKVDLAFRSFVDSKGEVRFCYVTPNGKQSPTLRVKPGDTVILNFKNEATATLPQTRTAKAAAGAVAASTGAGAALAHSDIKMNSGNTPEAPCATGTMKATSTNLHFHALPVSIIVRITSS